MIVTICPGGFLVQVGFLASPLSTLSLVAGAVLDLFFCLAAIELAEMLVSRWGTVPFMPWLASAQCHS